MYLERDLLAEALYPYKVAGDYCEVCYNFDGEQRYLIGSVTICEVCLVDKGMWKEFPEIVDLVEQAEERERTRVRCGG